MIWSFPFLILSFYFSIFSIRFSISSMVTWSRSIFDLFLWFFRFLIIFLPLFYLNYSRQGRNLFWLYLWWESKIQWKRQVVRFMNLTQLRKTRIFHKYPVYKQAFGNSWFCSAQLSHYDEPVKIWILTFLKYFNLEKCETFVLFFMDREIF